MLLLASESQRVGERHGLSRAIKICGSVSTPRPSPIVCNRSRDVGEVVDNTRRHAKSTSALTDKKVCRVHASSHALLYNIERYRLALASSGKMIGGFS
jgi:hypothetical protein